MRQLQLILAAIAATCLALPAFAVTCINNGLAPSNSTAQLNGVAGVPGLVIGVGQTGSAGVVYVNGVASTLPAGTNQLNAVSVASTTYAVAVGEKIGAAPPPLLQFNGTTWTVMPTTGTPPTQDVMAVKTYGPNQTYAAAVNGLYFFNGTSWSLQQAAPAGANFVGLWGNATTIYGLADNGTLYTKAAATPPSTWAITGACLATLAGAGAQFNGITGDAAGNVYVTGQDANNKGFIYKYDPVANTCTNLYTSAVNLQLNGVAVNPTTGAITAVGDRGTVVTVSPTGTLLSYTPPTPGMQNINGVYIAPNGATYMAGQNSPTCTAPLGPDHIEIDHTGSALTCSPQIVTVKACADAACATLYTAGTSVTLSPGGLTFTIGAGGINNAAAVQQSTAGTATLGATSAPAAINATTCLNTVTGTASCAMTFSNSGFLITVPNHHSCSNATATIEAVQSAPGTARCVPAYQNVTRAVNLYTSYTDPTTGTLSVTASTGVVSTAAPGTAHNLAFDATGKATITLSYPDAGKLTLTANDTAPTGAPMTGSGTFVAAPASFALSAVTTAPIKAGNPFSATVTAKTAVGLGTACPAAQTAPNFGRETAPESVALSFTKCQPTGAASSSGLFSGSVPAFAAGSSTASNLSWSEVGNGDLVATLASGSYLGSGLTATGNTGSMGALCSAGTGNVGRFIPDHFDTAIINGCLGCGFTYAGQPFTVYVTARNGLTTPTTTVNYDGTANTVPNFAKATTLSVWDAATGATANPGPGTLSNTTVAASAFVSGVATLNTPATMPAYTFTTVPTAPTLIRVRAIDADNVSSLRVPFASSIEGQAEIRSGRIKIANAYGSVLLQLPISLTAQYWNGAAAGWVTSATDSSSSLVVATPPAAGAVSFGNYQKNLTAVSVAGSPKTVTFANGLGGFVLAAPGAGKDGSVDMSIPALTGAACNAAPVPLGCYLPGNTGRAAFGVYKGNNNFIYQRESY